MSRGVGNAQRRALLYLYVRGVENGVPLGELKRHIGEDRSNARRTLRTLTARGLVEELAGEDGERRVKLTSGAHFAVALTEALKERPPALGDVPSRPFDLARIFDYDEDERDSDPLESVNIPCLRDAIIESAVSDNAEYPMDGSRPHGRAPSPDEDAVSDNPTNTNTPCQ